MEYVIELHDQNIRHVLYVKAVVGYILITKIAAGQNDVALSYHRVRGLYFLAVVFCGGYSAFYICSVYYHTIEFAEMFSRYGRTAHMLTTSARDS